MKSHVAIIGAGLGGLSAAIRLASRGVRVSLFEQNLAPGGKAGEVRLAGYRFDTGPSLLTMPFVLRDVFAQAGTTMEEALELVGLDPLCRYQYDDGSVLEASSNREAMVQAIGRLSPDDAHRYGDFLRYGRRIYELTSGPFLFNSISDLHSILKLRNLRTLFRIWQIDPFRTVDRSVRRFFRDERIIQLFDRYATYNGSNPYRAPATLNIIPYVEHELGGFYVKGGMFRLVEALWRAADRLGVRLETGVRVLEIALEAGRARHIVTDAGVRGPFHAVISNADAIHTLTKLVRPPATKASSAATLEPSSSGLVFLWGVRKIHSALAHHNIFFSADYRKEFSQVFELGVPPEDPTVYVSITSKTDPAHAPEGSENWFVLLNVASSDSGLSEADVAFLRRRVLDRMERSGFGVSTAIEAEEVIRPQDFREKFGAFRGSIYGLSSNSRSAAFLRPANRVRGVRGLYLCGGSAHPGGGVPLVLLSGRIAASLCLNDLGLSSPDPVSPSP